MASVQTETSAALQKPDRYNLRFLTETNFIKLKRVKWPQPRPRFKQTFITKCNCIRYFILGIFLFNCSEIITGNCSNLYSKRRHYSCYWTEYLIVEKVTLLSTTFYKAPVPSISTSSTRRFLFEMSQTICLFYLISPRQLELKCCGDISGKHIIDETQSLNRISKQNKNLPNCLQIR